MSEHRKPDQLSKLNQGISNWTTQISCRGKRAWSSRFPQIHILVLVWIMTSFLLVTSLPAANVMPEQAQQQTEETVPRITPATVLLIIVGVTGLIIGGLSSWADWFNRPDQDNRAPEVDEQESD